MQILGKRSRWIFFLLLFLLIPIAGSQTVDITSFDATGILGWSVDRTNTWCGLEYTVDLDGPWGRLIGEFWNLHTSGYTNSLDIGIENIEGMDTLFLRIACSTNDMLGEPFDLDTERIPIFVSSDYIDLSKIYRISRFRSGEGHDNSDDFESAGR